MGVFLRGGCNASIWSATPNCTSVNPHARRFPAGRQSCLLAPPQRSAKFSGLCDRQKPNNRKGRSSGLRKHRQPPVANRALGGCRLRQFLKGGTPWTNIGRLQCRTAACSDPPTCKPRRDNGRRLAIFFAIIFSIAGTTAPALAAKPDGASTSRSTRDEAVRLIPMDKLTDDGRQKVAAVMSQVSIFRRLPTQVIACDPKLYLFLIEHPDMVVNMWEVMDVSDMRLEKTGPDSYRANDGVGTAGKVEYLHHSYDTHVMYAEGSYNGPLFINPVHGRCLLVLKTGYVQNRRSVLHHLPAGCVHPVAERRARAGRQDVSAIGGQEATTISARRPRSCR